MASNWKVSPRNFRPWTPLVKQVSLEPVPNMTIDLRYRQPQSQPWWSFLWERTRGGWRKR